METTSGFLLHWEGIVGFLLFSGTGVFILSMFLYNKIYDPIEEFCQYLFVRQRYSIDVEIINTREEPTARFSFVLTLVCDQLWFQKARHFNQIISWKKVNDDKIVDTIVPLDVFCSCRKILFTKKDHRARIYLKKFEWSKNTKIVDIV